MTAQLSAPEGDVPLPRGRWDPHAVASTLKAFFRSHSDSVVPGQAWDDWLQVYQHAEDDQPALVNAVVVNLPRWPAVNRHVFAFMLRFLARVANHHHENRMTASNLAMVWGPTLLHGNPGICSMFLELCLDHIDQVLGRE